MAAGFGAQANALLRKSATYQKRNVRTNICLVSSPIFFCLILLAIKVTVDKVFLASSDLKCGCRCIECCDSVTGECEALNQGFCDADNNKTCNAYDKSNCGLVWSTPQQGSFCEVTDPSTWPPVVQIPEIQRRAQPAAPGVTTLVTAPAPPSFTTSDLDPYVYTRPLYIDNTTFLDLLPQLVTENGTVNAHLFSKYLLTFGTATSTGQNQYIERAFAGFAPLNLLLPYTANVSCEKLAALLPQVPGLTPLQIAHTPIPLIDMLIAVVNFTSGTVVTQEQVNAALGSRPVLANFLEANTVCTDVISAPQQNVSGINDLLYCGYTQARCNGTPVTAEYPPALEFVASAPATLDLNVYYNGTDDSAGNNGPDAYLRVHRTLTGGVSAWWYNMLGNSTLLRSERLLGLMSMPKHASKLQLDFSNLLGPLFYTWVVQMLLPTFLQQLVYEKEKRLRMMMKMHGLGDGAYWLITYLWNLALYVVYIIIFIIFGAGVGLEIFRRTNMGIQIIFYFLFGNCMIAFAFALSSLFSSSRTSTVVAFIYVFATGLIGELLLKVFMEKNAKWVFFIEWIPAFALYRGLWEMAEYSFLGVYRNERGLTFARLSDTGCGMRATWGIFVVEWAVFMVLGWYLEQVLSSGTGIRRHPLFFLGRFNPAARRSAAATAAIAAGGGAQRAASLELTAGRGGSETHGNGAGSGAVATKVQVVSPSGGSVRLTPGEREDVRAERLRVEGLGPAEAAELPIVVRDLRKVYPPLDGGQPKLAVRTLTLAIERGECFGLLGPNGAGKSTSLNMLTGFLEPTAGSAVVEGHDIASGMDAIYRLMGVCPQHDLLWEQLTGEEHLLFYGRLKGLKGAELASAVTSGLKSVNLFNNYVGQKQAQKYSGGMKRRLSVAISFIGDPRVVYLDEPSTGLDPASRRNLWDVVRANKAGRALILTTHSMEEAEILCDRLGIFVDGQLVCIGNPREITSRYAGYLVFTLTVGPGHEDAAKAFVASMSPNARLTYALGGTFKYELPASDVGLAGVFDAMERAKGAMAVLDWGVANATLEEVFIKFARQIGAEAKDV